MEKKVDWKKTILKFLLGALLLGGLFLIIYLVLRHFGYDKMTQEELQALIEKTGIYGKIVFTFISFLQVTFVPIPGAITILAGNYLFGFWEGFLLSFIGMLLGSLLAFFLGKTIGRKFVNWAFGSKEQVDYYLSKLKGKETVLLFFMFFLPMFPDDALCAVAGLTKMKTSTFTIMQLITRPTSILGTLLFMSGEVIPYKGWGLVIIISVGILSLVGFIFAYKYSDKINSWLEKISEKITSLLKHIKEN